MTQRKAYALIKESIKNTGKKMLNNELVLQ